MNRAGGDGHAGRTHRDAPAALRPADRWFVARMFLTGSVVIAESSMRAWSRGARLCVEHAPALIELTRGASSVSGEAPVKQAELRDEVLGLAREIAVLGWLEARRAIDELDTRTREPEAVTPLPTRPYSYKS